MKPIYIAILVVLVLAGGWYVKAKKDVDQTADLPSLFATPTSQAMTGTSGASPSPQPIASTTAPNPQGIILTISTPTDGMKVTNSTITVKGKTKAFAEVFVNDEEDRADANGNFSVKLTLDEGDNPIVISVNDVDGNVAEEELIVYYEAD